MKKNIFSIKKTIGALTLGILLLVSSCTDNFYDINKKPEGPINKEVPLSYLIGLSFPNMIDNIYPVQENRYQMGENLIGDPYGRYLSIANAGWTTSFSTFNASDNWINTPYNDVYSGIYTGWYKVKSLTDANPIFAHLFQWAQLLRVTGMQRMVDLYGPMPYSKVPEGGIATAYDSQEEVYKAMFNDLDTAIDSLYKFNQENPENVDMEEFDHIYKGYFSKWVRFGNTLKLRMAMRIVYADPSLAKQKAEEAVSHPGGLIDANRFNALNLYPKNPINLITNDWQDSKACADIIAYMNGYKDPRLEKYFTKSNVKGGSEFLGLRTGVSMPSNSKQYSSTTYKDTDPVLVMNAAETYFLKAEGALRGWNMGGDVKDLYETGIKLSFEQWGAGSADAYMKNDSLQPAGIEDPYVYKGKDKNGKEILVPYAAGPISTITIAWNDGDSFEKKLERLITQKWIAMYPLGQEAWSDQRRTGYPRFYPVLQNSSADPNLTTRLASRIPFPPDEKFNNAENYKKAVQLLGGEDAYGTKLWWDKNPNKGW